MIKINDLNFSIGEEYITKIKDIKGGVHFLKAPSYNSNDSLDYELNIIKGDYFYNKIFDYNLKTILTYIGDNKFQEYYSNIIIRLTDNYQLSSIRDFGVELNRSYQNPLYVSIDDLDFDGKISDLYQNEIRKYLLDYERYCLKSIKEEFSKEEFNKIVR